MMTLFDFSKKISQLNRDGKYSEALIFFEENKSDFSNEQIAGNEYLISAILTSLRKTNNVDAGFNLLDIYKIKINDETNEVILNAYGWLLWSEYKLEYDNDNDQYKNDATNFNENEGADLRVNSHDTKNELIKKIEILIPLLENFNSDYSKTVISNLLSIVLKSEKKKPVPNWKLINEFCNAFDVNKLSTKCVTFEVERGGKKRKMEQASDKEKWFAYKTKALFKLEEWQECLDLSKEALEKLDKFHYSNDVWFARRIALSKKKIGDSPEDIILELKSILQKKKEWFIQKELAEIYFEEGDMENAFKYAIQAIVNFGDLEYKVDLLFLIGKILNNKNEKDLAFKHFSLSKLIRESKGWKIPQDLFDELQNFENKEIDIQDVEELKQELQTYWKKCVPEKSSQTKSKKLQGIILKFLNDNERGKNGFLKCDDKEYYFTSSSEYKITSEINVGTKVEFKILPAADNRREQARILKILE